MRAAIAIDLLMSMTTSRRKRLYILDAVYTLVFRDIQLIQTRVQGLDSAL